MRNVVIGTVQMQCSKSVREERGANVILLPELFERPYFCQERRYSYYSYAKPLLENDAVCHFKNVAKELGVVLPVSFYEKDGNVLYNSAAMIDADGEILGVYRKTHIPDDHYYQEKFYSGKYRIYSVGYTLWKSGRWNLLGSVVSGNSKVSCFKWCGNDPLSHSYRKRADFKL